jgi:hypothetical protein
MLTFIAASYIFTAHKHSPMCAISKLTQFKKKVKNEITGFLNPASNFALRVGKRSEKKVAEEYYWTITQAAERSCCDSEGFQLDRSVYMHIQSIICIFNSALGKMRLTPDVSEGNTSLLFCISIHMCVT